MLKLTIAMHKKSPGYQVKAVVTVGAAGESKSDITKKLDKLQDALDQTIPRSMHARCKVDNENLNISIAVEKASQAQTIQRKLEDFIHSAASDAGIR